MAEVWASSALVLLLDWPGRCGLLMVNPPLEVLHATLLLLRTPSGATAPLRLAPYTALDLDPPGSCRSVAEVWASSTLVLLLDWPGRCGLLMVNPPLEVLHATLLLLRTPSGATAPLRLAPYTALDLDPPGSCRSVAEVPGLKCPRPPPRLAGRMG